LGRVCIQPTPVEINEIHISPTLHKGSFLEVYLKLGGHGFHGLPHSLRKLKCHQGKSPQNHQGILKKYHSSCVEKKQGHL
jgi:hypothetical protein